MDRKIFGIGMSKTGTTTLGRCFQILGLGPTVKGNWEVRELARAGRPMHPVNLKFAYDFSKPLLTGVALERMVAVAKEYRSFHDAPWYMLYRELDEAFPGSQFILTIRQSAEVQARSDWHNNCATGRCSGEPDRNFIFEQAWRYASHNYHVVRYFHGRERDLLVICWEDGDGWEKLCGFLELPVPAEPFPHENPGRYSDPSR